MINELREIRSPEHSGFLSGIAGFPFRNRGKPFTKLSTSDEIVRGDIDFLGCLLNSGIN